MIQAVTEIADRVRGFLRQRKQAYQITFDDSPESQAVLRDLAVFCRAGKPTFHTDPRVSAMLEGRREVWLRIADHLKLSTDDLYRLYGKGDSQ